MKYKRGDIVREGKHMGARWFQIIEVYQSKFGGSTLRDCYKLNVYNEQGHFEGEMGYSCGYVDPLSELVDPETLTVPLKLKTLPRSPLMPSQRRIRL